MLDEGALAVGAENMFVRCGGLRPGDKMLIVHEPAGLGYYDNGLAGVLALSAGDLGFAVSLQEHPFNASPTMPDADLVDKMRSVDMTVFLARIGDQLRFDNLPSNTRAIVSYALGADALTSSFGTLDHVGMCAIRDAVDAALIGADQITITCKAGTHLVGSVRRDGPVPTDTNTIRFPKLVHTPMPAVGFSGRLAQRGFLVGTGSRYYQPYACPIGETLIVQVKGNRIVGFDGSADDVAQARAHYAHVAGLYGIDEGFIHSWHAGIHPGCAFTEPASASFERWTGSAFGNPRLLHFHTCGAYAPGEISVNIVDPTISVDGDAIYEDGRFHPDRVPGGSAIMDRYPLIAEAYANPATNCGLGPDGRLAFA